MALQSRIYANSGRASFQQACNASPGACTNHHFGCCRPCMNISWSGTGNGDASTVSSLPETGHYQEMLLPFFLFNPMNLKIFSTGHPGFGKRAVLLPKGTHRVLLQGHNAGALAFSGQGGSCIQSSSPLTELSKHQQAVCRREAEEPYYFAARATLATFSHHSKFIRDVEEGRCNLGSLLGLGPEGGTVARTAFSEGLLEMS